MADDKVFVNLQDGSVQVFDENRRPVKVAPWSRRNLGNDGIYEVSGAHYEQFVSAKGPLFPRPQEAKPAPAASDKGQAGGAGTGGSGSAETATVTDLTVLAVKEAVAVMEDVDLLKGWLALEAAGEDRKGATDAIEARIADLEADTVGLSEHTVPAAEEVIEGTDDVDLLKEWAEIEAAGEDRKGVKEAIEKRIAALEADAE